MTLQVFSNSAVADQIKESMRLYKNEEFPICGDYYYTIIDSGILFKKPIKINLQHFTNLPEDYTEIFKRVVLEIFAEKFGRSLAEQAVKEERVNLEFETQ
jgi:hypothetical protein